MSDVFRCEICGNPLKFATAHLEMIDKVTGGYPSSPDTLGSRLACSDCDTDAYHIPLRDLVAMDGYDGWLTHLMTKKWMDPGFYFDVLEAHGIAEQLQALAPKPPALKVVPRPAPSSLDSRSPSNNPRSISLSMRARVMERDGFRCRRCGCGPADARLVIDHVVPVARGGTAALSNLQTLCHPCNAGKSDRDPHEHDSRFPE